MPMNLPLLYSHRYLIAAALAGVLVIGSGVYWYLERPDPNAETFTDAYELTLQAYDGSEVRLSDFKREILIVHTWASWCPYCGEELQNLARLKEQYGDDITILAVNRAEPADEARAFTRNLGIPDGTMEIMLDPDDAFYKEIEGYAMPETVFIHDNGEVFFHQRGPMKMDEVRTMIDQLVEAN
jgi:thiol-disulfide isomerase/thioredoxin